MSYSIFISKVPSLVTLVKVDFNYHWYGIDLWNWCKYKCVSKPMADIITVNYECNRSARSIATANTAGKSLFFQLRTIKLILILDILSPQWFTFRIRSAKNRHIPSQFRRRWFPEAFVTHINYASHLDVAGPVASGGRDEEGEREGAEASDKPMDTLAARQEGAAKSHTALHVLPAVLLGTNSHLYSCECPIKLCGAVWCVLTLRLVFFLHV